MTALASWCVTGAIQYYTRPAAWREPTRGVALYLGLMVTAALLVFAAPGLRRVRPSLAWAIASGSVLCSGITLGKHLGVCAARIPPSYILSELPAASLGVLLMLVAVGRVGFPVSAGPTRASAAFALTTLLRSSACVLLALACATHALWLLSSHVLPAKAFLGWLSGQLVPAQLCFALAVQAMLSLHLPARRILKLASLASCVATCSAKLLELPSAASSLSCIVAACCTVALVASRHHHQEPRPRRLLEDHSEGGLPSESPAASARTPIR